MSASLFGRDHRLEHFLGAGIAQRPPEVARPTPNDHEAKIVVWSGGAAFATVGTRRCVERELGQAVAHGAGL